MSQASSWNMKGSDQKARDAAREAALAEGITLVEYLNRMLSSADNLEADEIRPPYGAPAYNNPSHQPPSRPEQTAAAASALATSLDRLTRRIEASEARATLAITGIDHTVLGLAARIDGSEQTTAGIASHIESLIEDLRSTHEALQAKVRRLEEDETSAENAETLKALEQALSKLASHIFEEAELAQNEAIAIKGRVEAGFTDLTERMESVETRTERSASEMTHKIERAIEQAEMRSDGVNRHLSERLSRLEQEPKADTGHLETRLSDLEGDIADARNSLETSLLDVQERLSLAETSTDSSLQGLEANFAALDERINTVANAVDPDLASTLRQEFETKLGELNQLVRTSVDTARKELASEYIRATEKDAEARTQLHAEIDQLKARLAEAEANKPDDMIAALRGEISRLGTTVSERMDNLAEHVETRLEESEIRSADAIEQVGEQVTVAAVRLQKRQDEALTALAREIEATRNQTDAHLKEALTSVSERLEDIHTQSVTALSPVQRAIAALAARLESLEAFTSPPNTDLPPPIPVHTHHAEASPSAPLPQYEPEETDFESLLDFADEAEDAFELTPPTHHAADTLEEADFASGFEDWTDAEGETLESAASKESGFGADFESIRAAVERMNAQSGTQTAPASSYADEAEEDDEDHMFIASLPDEVSAFGPDDYDPLDELADLEEARTETRESDIFDDEEALQALSESPKTTTKPTPAKQDLQEKPAAPTSADDNPDTSDYLARARRAAMAAAETQGRPRKGASPAPVQKPRQMGKAPLYLAASAVVLSGAGVGTYLYLRGKQPPEAALSGPIDTYVDPALASAAETAPEAAEHASSREAYSEFAAQDAPAAEEEDLFDTASADAIDAEMFEPATAAETPAPAPVLATLTPAPAASYAPIPAIITVESEANAGNAIAQYQLSISLRTSGDLDGAIAQLRRAATKGIAPAQYDLGKLYEHGYGVDQSYVEARNLITSAAEAGHVSAMYDLALFLAEGEGGPADASLSADWFRKAANHGFTDAQYNLGVLYAEGIGVPQDLAEALYWFKLASRTGDDGATLEVENLSARLPQATVTSVMQKADMWQETPSAALANGRFGAQRWNAGNPLQVRAIQTALSSLGYLEGNADGVLGQQTASAISAYQRSKDLPVTGTVTPTLIESLNSGASQSRG